MDSVLERISKLVASKHLVPAEQVLMSTIAELNDLITSDCSNEVLERIEELLLSIYTINNGDFSVQCSIYIASSLCRVYGLMKKPEFWGAINLSIDLTTASTIVATGYIIRKYGHNFRAQLPRLVEHYIKQEGVDFAVLYALTKIFKVGGQSIASLLPKSILFAKKVLMQCNSVTMQMVIKFFKTSVKLINSGICKEASIQQILESIHVCTVSTSPFVQNDSAELIAQCAYAPFVNISTGNDESEWEVGSQKREAERLDFTKSFEIMNMFPEVINSSVEEFLKLLGSELISLNHESLMVFVRKSAFEVTPKLISMLPSDVIYLHFRAVLKEEMSEQQIKLIPLLCPDDGSLDDAAVAEHLAYISNNKEVRRASKKFFTDLSKSHPQTALSIVERCFAVCIQNPDNQSLWCAELSCASLILRSVNDNEAAVQKHAKYINEILKLTFEKVHPESPKFSAVLSLVTSLPNNYLHEEIVKNAIDAATKEVLKEDSQTTLKTFPKLLTSLCLLMVRSEDATKSMHIVVAAVMSNVHFSKKLLISLSKLIPRVLNDQPLAVSAARLIVKEIKKLTPSAKCVMDNLERPLPHGLHLLHKPFDLSSKQLKDDEFLMTMYELLPSVFRSCPKSDLHIIVRDILDVDKHNQSTMLLCLTITKNSDLQFSLPRNFPTLLLKLLMSPDNRKITQIVCENLAYYTSVHQSLLPILFNHIDSHPSVQSTLLLDSIFAHMFIQNEFISRAIVFLDCRMKDKTQLQFAVHALTTLILTHSMQVATLGITTNQFNVLLGALHQPQSLMPVALYMCCECFRSLIEVVSSDISAKDTELATQVSIILRTFEYTPVKYAKELYFECARSIYTFIHTLNKYAPIEYPASPSISEMTALAACQAFSDLLKFEKVTFDIANLLPKLLTLLQATDDDRASSFIVAIASTMGDDDLAFWIATIRRIIITGSLHTESTSTIEPTPNVKLCMLHVAKFIPPVLSKTFALKTEYLDDLISSMCRATETERATLQEAAFPVLQNIIELFRDRKAEEGGRLLDLYDSQFAQTIKVGFRLPLNVSGGFLSTYLSFSTANVESDPENCSAVLVVYLTGLKECQQRNSAYFQLATHLCTVARKYTSIHDLIKPFLKKSTPIFGEIVLKAMNLYRNKNDWRALTEFRSFTQTFYIELLPAFVWLQSTGKVYIDYDPLISFLCIELKHSREQWMANAAFDALCVAMETIGSKLNTQLIKLTLECAVNYEGVTKDKKVDLINRCSELLKEDESFDDLRVTILSFCIHENFSPNVIAHLLKSDKRRILAKYTKSILGKTIEALRTKQITQEVAAAIFTMLLAHTKSLAGIISECALALGEEYRDFILEVLPRTISVKGTILPLDKIARFCITSFKRGGMQLAATALIHNPECGVELLKKGCAKAAFLLASRDAKNAKAYLLFLQLGLQVANTCFKATDFAVSLFRLCVSIASKLKQDSVLDRKFFFVVIRIIKDCEAVASLEEAYSQFDESERNSMVSMMDVCIKAERQRKKTEQLVAFSTNQRSSKCEWQTLDIED